MKVDSALAAILACIPASAHTMQCHHWKEAPKVLPTVQQEYGRAGGGLGVGGEEGGGSKGDSLSHVHQCMSTIHAHEVHDYGIPYKSACCKHPRCDAISSSFTCQYVMSLCN